MTWWNKRVLRFLKVPHSFEVLAVNCSTLDTQQPKIDDRQTQFCNTVQSEGLELMKGAYVVVGMSVVCQKGIGSAFVIKNTMLTV